MKHIPSLFMVLLLLMPLASVRAAIIYNESVDGDASPANLGVLGIGTHRVKGNIRTVGGAVLPDDPILLTNDTMDTFQFEIGVGTKLDSIWFLNSAPDSLRFYIVELIGNNRALYLSPGEEVLQKYNMNVVGAGVYNLMIERTGHSDANGFDDYPYEVDFQVSSTSTAIPEPSTLAIFSGMSVGLFGFEFWRRRRIFASPSRMERRR